MQGVPLACALLFGVRFAPSLPGGRRVPHPTLRPPDRLPLRRDELACDPTSSEAIGTAAIRVAAERAAFGGEAGRRRVLKVLGAATVAAAMDRVFPILRAQEAWAEGAGGPPEKKDLKIGFIADHLRHADHPGRADGVLRQARPERGRGATAGWAVVRDKALNGEYDATHMLSPMPLALTLGVGSNPCRSRCRRSRTSTARRSRWP